MSEITAEKVRVHVPGSDTCGLVTEDNTILERFRRYNGERDHVFFTGNALEADIIVLFEHFSVKMFSYVNLCEAECPFISLAATMNCRCRVEILEEAMGYPRIR